MATTQTDDPLDVLQARQTWQGPEGRAVLQIIEDANTEEMQVQAPAQNGVRIDFPEMEPELKQKKETGTESPEGDERGMASKAGESIARGMGLTSLYAGNFAMDTLEFGQRAVSEAIRPLVGDQMADALSFDDGHKQWNEYYRRSVDMMRGEDMGVGYELLREVVPYLVTGGAAATRIAATVLGKSAFATGMAAGAVADFTMVNPEEGNLATMFRDMDMLPEYLEFMESSQYDEAMAGRLVSTLEGGAIGTALEPVFRGLGAAAKSTLKYVRETHRAGLRGAEFDALAQVAAGNPEGVQNLTRARIGLGQSIDDFIDDMVDRGFQAEDAIELFQAVHRDMYAPKPSMGKQGGYVDIYGGYTPPEPSRYKTIKASGQYSGAPKGIDTKRKFNALKKRMTALVDEGEIGRFWYEKSGEVVNAISPNERSAKRMAQFISTTSPSMTVPENYMHALKAYYQDLSGAPIQAGLYPNQTQAGANLSPEEWLETGGRKTTSFSTNILQSQFPDSYADHNKATINMWVARAFGYPTDSVGDAQYTFMENMLRDIALEKGWTPYQVQAALWTSIKSRWEHVAREHPNYGRERMIKESLKSTGHEVTTFDFSDAAGRYLGQVNWEAAPGANTGKLPGYHTAPDAQKIEFYEAIREVMIDEDGLDIIAKELGLLTPGSIDASGVYRNESGALEFNPSGVVGFAIPRTVELGIEPSAQRLMDAYTAIRGMLLNQEMQGYHVASPAKNLKESNNALFDFGRGLSKEEMGAMQDAAEQALDGYQDFALIAADDGVNVYNWGDMDNAAFIKGLQRANSDQLPDVVELTWGRNLGRVFNTTGQYADESYEGAISSTGSQAVYERLHGLLAPRIEEVYKDFETRYGWGKAGKQAGEVKPKSVEGAES